MELNAVGTSSVISASSSSLRASTVLRHILADAHAAHTPLPNKSLQHWTQQQPLTCRRQQVNGPAAQMDSCTRETNQVCTSNLVSVETCADAPLAELTNKSLTVLDFILFNFSCILALLKAVDAQSNC